MEKQDKNKTKYQISILRPGGNNTMLIKGLVKNSNKKKLINDQMMSLYPNVEQVGFYEFNPKTNIATLEMAGGEFCGNATRSLAYLLLNGKQGQITVKVLGTSKGLKAGIRKENTAFAQMPVTNFKSIKKLRTNLFRVDLEGITQLVYIQNEQVLSKRNRQINSQNLKSYAFKILQRENLIYSVPAAGVIFVTDRGKFIEIKPIVWVRDIETLFYETACASGTAAVGIWKAFQTSKKVVNVKILQPSGKLIEAEISKKSKSLIDVYIDGEIEILQRGSKKI